MTEKERLKRTFQHKEVDRKPVICPGGMMNMITTDLMELAGVCWPEAHTDASKMAALSYASYENGCFENMGAPFCMTVEAEALGAEVTMGNKLHEPHVTKYAISSVTEWEQISPCDPETGRMKVVTDAIRILKQKNPDVPVIGNITGPISTASSLMEPVHFYKELRKNRKEAHAYLAFVTGEILKFACAQLEAGADVITISDPGGTGEILGPRFFEEYAVTYLNMLLDGLGRDRAGTIVHICGQMHSVYDQINEVKSDALSFDAIVPMKQAREHLRDRVLMGNVSTYALEFGTESQIAKMTKGCIRNGADIIAPACGLGTKSPIANIKRILETVKEEERKDA